ncbi:MAG: phosphohistidine phosphatase SixA [Cyanobacteria bacterium P01_E01_bin.6]
MTTVYFIRHGIAAERGTYANDDDRPLTEAGIRKTQRIAQHLHELDVTVDLILSSPLVRARQTAEILKSANLAESITISADVAPGGDMKRWLQWLNDWEQSGRRTLAMVGHQPDLGNWAETLVWGEPIGRIIVKKAGMIGVELPATGSPIGASDLFWLTPPRLFIGT